MLEYLEQCFNSKITNNLLFINSIKKKMHYCISPRYKLTKVNSAISYNAVIIISHPSVWRATLTAVKATSSCNNNTMTTTVGPRAEQ